MSDRKACAALGLNGTGALYKLQEEDSALAARFAHARRAGAAAMASECLDIADDLVEHETADPVRVANARIAQRQLLAARRNREEFGDSAKVAVQINVADMHLTALQDVPVATPDGVAPNEPQLVQGSTFASLDDQRQLFAGCVYVSSLHRVLVPGGYLLDAQRFNALAPYGRYTYMLYNPN